MAETPNANSSTPEDPRREQQGPPHPAEPKPGWIEGLAMRSTGLPGDAGPSEKLEADKSPWRFAGLGIQFAATTAVFAWMGWELDRRMGWSPWGLVSLSMFAVIGGLYLLIKEVVKEGADTDDRDGKNQGRQTRK
jgi:F0F1-type ATP synthase assembly protein I